MMTNLAKCYLTCKNKDVGTHHGISQYNRNSSADTIKLSTPKDHVSTFFQFSELLNGYSNSGDIFSFEDLTEKILEVHKIDSMWISQGNLKYAPVKLEFVEYCNENNVKMFNLQARFAEEDKSIYKLTKFLKNGREKIFRRTGPNTFLLKRSFKVDYDKFQNKINSALSKAHECGFVDLLDSYDYTHYCYLGKNTYHHLCYPYLLMFYVGYLARYHPSKTLNLTRGERYGLLNESVNLCPPQFTYQILSRIIEKHCVLPKGWGKVSC